MRQTRSDKLVKETGFSLVEVLIAALVAGFAIAAAMQVFINQNKNQIVQAGVTDMQQNGRATVDELVQKIRQAGYRLPKGIPALLSWNTNPDTIALSFLVEPLCTASLTSAMPQPSAELKCNFVGCFISDVWAYIYDPFVDSGEFFFITHVQHGSKHLQHNLAPLSKKYPAGSQVFMLDFYKYYVDNTTDPAKPKFMVYRNGSGPLIFADNIEDLQFRYVQANGTVLDTISVDRYVREVQIDVVARTSKHDLFLKDFRRDTLRTSVMVRNLGMQ